MVDVDPPVFVNVIVAFEGVLPIGVRAEVDRRWRRGDRCRRRDALAVERQVDRPAARVRREVAGLAPEGAGVNVIGTLSVSRRSTSPKRGAVPPAANTGVWAWVAFCAHRVDRDRRRRGNVADAIELPPRLVGAGYHEWPAGSVRPDGHEAH